MEERLIRDEDKVDPVEMICVVDRSGSMHDIVDDAVGGYNSFVADQKRIPGEAYLTLAIFDDKYEIVYECKPLLEVPEATIQTFKPRGNTALWDAVGKTLEESMSRLLTDPRRVIVVIITDGHENASHKYTSEQVKTLIETCKGDGWEFMFLGANIDAFAESSNLGIAASQTVQYAANARGVQSAYMNISETVSQFRGVGTSDNTEGEGIS